jgi:hypothetical protein
MVSGLHIIMLYPYHQNVALLNGIFFRIIIILDKVVKSYELFCAGVVCPFMACHTQHGR